jgi:hypothetical protein
MHAPELAIAGLFIAVWVVIGLVRMAGRLPTPYAALAAWDAAAGRKEIFSSAYIFERELADAGQRADPGRALHIATAREQLSREIGQLPRELALPPLRWRLAAPAAALGLVFIPWLKPQLSTGDSPLTAEMLAAARAEAGHLSQPDDKKLAAMKELTAEERKKLEELEQSIKATADKLKDPAGQTPRDVLTDLEKRAREAEELAKQLGADNSAWASEQMLGEMRKHPDTANLASAIKDRNPGRSADESQQLAEELKSSELTAEAAGRMRGALDRTMDKATADDHKKMVGQHVGEADRKMTEQQPADAGEEFQKLAEKFRRLEQRENAQKELQKLAERLRQSGSSIMGQNSEAMKKLAGSSSKDASQSSMPEMTPLGEMDGERSDSGQLPVPGFGQMPDFKLGKGRGSVIPGTGKLPKDVKSLTLIPGTVDKADGVLPLAAPIPGTAPGKVLIPGGSSGGDQALAGGLLAGRGHVPSSNSPTKPKTASAQGEVAASINDDGESFVQAIDGQPHNEAALRSAKRTATEFLKVQEEAFDEKALPPSRRKQVRRYFEAIRQQFEE